MACVCNNWCSLDVRYVLLTGHHENCPKCNVFKSALSLIKELRKGMNAWAQDTDGVHPEAWEAFCKASELEGIYLDPNEEPS